MSIGFSTKIATGLAELLAAAGVGEWLPAGQRTGTPVPWVTLVNVPETPDQIIALTAYSNTPNTGGTEVIISVQVRTRGDRVPSTPIDLQDAVFDALHGRRRTMLGTVPNQVLVSQIVRRNATAMGSDALSRWEWSSTYDVYVNRANANLTPDA